jgi:hypothetical protein
LSYIDSEAAKKVAVELSPDRLDRSMRFVLSVVALAALGGCPSSRRPPPKAPAPSVSIGECADPERDGTVSANPDLRRADRDLDRDGVEEVVVADRTLCAGDNCHWNLFSLAPGEEGCHRFLGTIAGGAIELGAAGDGGFPELRSWWRFDDERALLHVFHFRRAGYRLSETLLCRQGGDDGVECVSEDVR